VVVCTSCYWSSMYLLIDNWIVDIFIVASTKQMLFLLEKYQGVIITIGIKYERFLLKSLSIGKKCSHDNFGHCLTRRISDRNLRTNPICILHRIINIPKTILQRREIEGGNWYGRKYLLCVNADKMGQTIISN
jgi:hypothetical protein